ncbi:MAG: endonuclease III [Deltaproteobacteria bacterium]|jgi:endonuclease III|nr:endonuclease III [Deltaproteobacteria bacterium]
MRKDTILKILKLLKKSYTANVKPWLKKSDPYKTLISTILSAQTTDDQVDKITPELFQEYPTPSKLGKAKVAEVERIIKSVGLYKAKARNVIATGRMIVEEFGGQVPQARADMVRLPGVGRKTANVVLIKSFNEPAMPVDTHVFRVANRIGLAIAKTPEKTEEQLVKIIPRKDLGAAHFWLISHGRVICHARSPECERCSVARYCQYFKELK